MTQLVDPNGLGFLVNDVARLIRADFERRIAEAGLGLTSGEGRVLVHIARCGAIRQTNLAERLGIEAMTVSGYLDRLEGKELVRREADPNDRRAKQVSLTADGEEMLRRITPLSAALRADASAGVDQAEWARFLEILKQVQQNLAAPKQAQVAA